MSAGRYQQLKRLFLSLLALFALLTAVLAYLSHSAAGTRWLVDRLVTGLPGELRTEGFEGTLSQGITVKQLEYRHPAWQLSATDLRLQIDWRELLTGRLVINQVAVAALHHRQTTGPSDGGEPLTLSLPNLPLALLIKTADVAELSLVSGQRQSRLHQLKLRRARLRGDDLLVAELGVTVQGVTLTTTRLSASLREAIPVKARFSWRYVDKNLAGRGSINGSLAKLAFSHTFEQPESLRVEGSLQLLNRVEPFIQATMHWSGWQIADYRLQQGQLKLRGTPSDYQLSVTTPFLLADETVVDIKGSAMGNHTGLVITRLEASSSAGLLHLSGPVSWQPVLTAEMAVTFSDFDPSLWSAQLQGQINGSAALQITGTEQATVRHIDLTGHLNGSALRAGGELRWSPRQWQCSGCLFEIGSNRLRADGTINGQQLALEFELDAAELQQLWPQLGGQLEASGRLQGPVTLPRFDGTLQARQLRYGPWSADDFRLRSATQSAGQVQIEAAVKAVRRDRMLIGSGVVEALGEPEKLRFDFDWQRQQLKFHSTGALQWQQSGWSGSIDTAVMDGPGSNWQLHHPVAFEYRDGTAVVAAHSWAGQSGRAVIRQLRFGRETDINAELQQLPLSIVNDLLPSQYRLAGTADATFDLARREGNWQGAISWKQRGTLLRVAEPSLDATEVSMPQLDIGVSLTGSDAQLTMNAELDPGLEASLTAAVNQLASDPHIDGQVYLRGDQWGWLPAVFPAVDDVAGEVTATMKFKGPLQRPDLGGEVALRDGRLAIPALNITLEQVSMTLQGRPQGRVLISSKATAGDGSLLLNGEIDDLLSSTRSVTLTLEGDSALVADWPEYRVWISPQLRVTGDAQGWRTQGSVAVPYAEITPRDLPESAVTPSADVQVLQRPAASRSQLALTGEVRLIAGERVQLKMKGLDTRLSGELLVAMNAGSVPNVQGQLAFKDGIFKVFGQSLTIRKGTLTYGGPPDAPLVDVVAIREIAELGRTITAGIHIVGYPAELTTTVFSEPPLGEADALSYLVAGRPLSGLSESQGGDLASAALSLSISQAAPIARELGERFGVDELSVSGGGDEMALVVGKNLGRRWYARYAYGVFSQIGTLFLGYRLGENLLLEAGTGEHQTIDLLYSVEQP